MKLDFISMQQRK
jgi:hypothetical protein